MRGPYCLLRPRTAGIVVDPTPVTGSVTGAVSDVGENKISKLS